MSNLVPNGWRRVQLGDVVEPRSSNVDKKTHEGEIPVQLCNYTDVYYNNRITSRVSFMDATAKEREIERFTLALGDVVITKDSETPNDIAVPAYVSEDLRGVVCGYHLTILRPYQGRSNGEYLAHLFQLPSIQHHFYLLANGITRFGLTADSISTAPLVLPPLQEQKKIAAILTSVDDVIEKIQAQIEKLKDLKAGMMQELLTRGVGVDGKPHTEFKDSPVGRIPKGWEVRHLADCCSKMTNGYVGSTRDIYVDKGVDYVLCQNVRPNVFVEKTHKYVREEFHQKNIRACLQEGDVLTVQTGAGNGDTCVVPKSYEGANCHALIISRPKKDILNPYFLAEYMNSDQGKQRVSIIATGGAHPHLNTTDLRREFIPLPPIKEQNQMVRSLRAVQKKYILLEEKKKKLAGSKKALMQDLLTGKVRVKVDS